MISIRFTVPGKPSPKKRPRVVRLTNGASHTYTPDETGYVAQVQAACLRALGGTVKPTYGPVYLSLYIRRHMADSWPKKKKATMEGHLTTATPDPINVAMNFCDALSGFVWCDDRQVHLKFVEARWVTEPDEVCVEIEEVRT